MSNFPVEIVACLCYLPNKTFFWAVAIVLSFLLHRGVILSGKSHHQYLRQFRMTSDSTGLATVPVYRESGSTRFSSMFCS
jgi:hypothetical protein